LPELLISILSFSFLPSGTSLQGIFGMFDNISSSLVETNVFSVSIIKTFLSECFGSSRKHAIVEKTI